MSVITSPHLKVQREAADSCQVGRDSVTSEVVRGERGVSQLGRGRTRLSHDDGMTLIELVIAASILFIVLTGVLSLLTQTIRMSAQAKQINFSTNAINSYVEWVRSLPYDQVSTESTGSVTATTTVDGAYTITITPTVTVSGEDPQGNLKELVLAVTVTRPDGYLQTYSTSILIRNRDQYLVGTGRSAATDPKVWFVEGSAPEGSVQRGTSVPIKVHAEASNGRTLETGSYWVDNVRKLRSATTTASAEWEIGTSIWDPITYYWDTTVVEDGVITVQDGLRTVIVYVRDSEGVEVYTSRQLLIDNFAPPKTSPAVHNPAGSVGGTLSWPAVYDGTTLAYGYEAEVRVQGTTSTSGNPFETGTAWTASPGYSGRLPSFVVQANYFNRYFARVRSVSAHPTSPLKSDWQQMAAPFVSRPLITGTYTVTVKNGALDTIKPSLSCTSPQFALASSTPTTYEWHRVETGLDSKGQPWRNDVVIGTTSTPSWTPSTATSINSKPTGISFYVKATCTPTGFMGGSAVTVSSNLANCPSLTSGGTLGEGTW